jgi:hypothetical protein
MMVYVATIKFEDFDCFGDKFELDDLIGVFRTEENAKKALVKEQEWYEKQGHTVTELRLDRRFLEK